MSIYVYNTLTRKKEKFVTNKPDEILMYVCGPTVYNFIHLGNARMSIVFDTVRRYLEYKGYKVLYISNFTDVDDKMIKASQEMNENLFEIANRYIKYFHEDVSAVNVRKADIHPRATENISEIISFIEGLIKKEYAYYSGGDVYFNTNKFRDYGKLSKQLIDHLYLGLRTEVGELKKDPLDFVLWKKAKKGEVYWSSPWGDGRPGWHIECSAMVKKYLGSTIDVHAGGTDLCFPHHENEIAQSEALTGKTMANYWLHNGYVNVDNEKMSKSLGNFILLRDLNKKYNPAAIRLYTLQAHYRNPINFNYHGLKSAENTLERISNTVINLKHRLNTTLDLVNDYEETKKIRNAYLMEFTRMMDDDFNTANAISILLKVVKEANKYLERNSTTSKSLNLYINLIYELTGILGIELNVEEALNDWIQDKIEEREKARKEKDFELADKIREELKGMNIILEDTQQGVRWKKITNK